MRFPILHPRIKRFDLDSSGIAGFFGGEESFAAMNSVHLMPGRRWMGWYNSPGSYVVAKKYGMLPNSKFWDGLFPGNSVKPEELVDLDSKSGSTLHRGVLRNTASEIGPSVLFDCALLRKKNQSERKFAYKSKFSAMARKDDWETHAT